MTTQADEHIRAFLSDEARRVTAAAPSLDEAVATLAPRLERRSTGGSRWLVVLFAAALLVAALGATIAVGSGLLRLPVINDLTPLPTTPDAWSRVVIESGLDGNVVASLAASPRGLLAIVTDYQQEAHLLASTDGRTWTRVPPGQHPSLESAGGGSGAAVVGTDRGFLLLVGAEVSFSTAIRPSVTPSVWASEDGFSWQRLASPAEDPDLAGGRMHAAATGGPGVVAVGTDNKAWFSTDGSDWTLAEVPPPPTELFEREGYPAPTVVVHGIAIAGDRLLAWGHAYADNAADERMGVDILWASSEGRSWANVLDTGMSATTFAGESGVALVFGGPAGFVVVGAPGSDTVWLSADGRAWERVGTDVFNFRSNVDGVASAAATSAGYVAVGGVGGCHIGSCPSAEAVIWTSADGRSWSRLPSDDLFTVTEPRDPAYTDGARANTTVAWGSRFVVGGAYDGRPAIWISDATLR